MKFSRRKFLKATATLVGGVVIAPHVEWLRKVDLGETKSNIRITFGTPTTHDGRLSVLVNNRAAARLSVPAGVYVVEARHRIKLLEGDTLELEWEELGARDMVVELFFGDRHPVQYSKIGNVDAHRGCRYVVPRQMTFAAEYHGTPVV